MSSTVTIPIPVIIAGSTAHFAIANTNPDTKAPEDASGSVILVLTDPTGADHKIEGGEIHHEGAEESGKYYADYRPTIVGLWHYEWIVQNQAVAQGDFDVESKKGESPPDLTDLRVLIPRARRKVEGPWGNANGRPPLTDDQVYAMVADACGEVVMLGGSLFGHKLEVKARDSLGGFPTEWRTDAELEEYEAAIIVAQTALDYYFHVFNNMRISESIKNEGTEWTWQLSANVIRSYLGTLVDERDKAIIGLRINKPLIDRFASNIRVRDQATVGVLEWWDINSPGITGSGLPGGQEATSVPWWPSGEGGGIP